LKVVVERESVDVLLRQETAVSDVLLRHTSDVLLRPVVTVREREKAGKEPAAFHCPALHPRCVACVIGA
jgi:hypothetical protein